MACLTCHREFTADLRRKKATFRTTNAIDLYFGAKKTPYIFCVFFVCQAVAALHAASPPSSRSSSSFRVGPIYSTIYPASGNACDFAYSVGAKYSYSVELR